MPNAQTNPRRSALLSMYDLLRPAGKGRADVALAWDDPPAYVKKFTKALAARGISKATPALPWIALVGALEKEGHLASIDWKTSMEDLRWSLDRLASLPKRAARWKWAKSRADELDDRSTLELLEIVGERLAAEDRFVLAQLDTGADEHNLVLVAKKDAKRLVALGKQAKYGDVDLFTGSELAKFQREREKEEKGERVREAADPDAQSQFLHADGRVWITYGRRWGSGADMRYALEVVTGKLGQETHSRGENETRISASAKEVARWRAREIAARLAEGFEEVSREVYVKRENAAAKAKKRKKRR